jgi:hypothetical protein
MLDQLAEIAGGLPPPQVSVSSHRYLTSVNLEFILGERPKPITCCFGSPFHTCIEPSDASSPDAQSLTSNRLHS